MCIVSIHSTSSNKNKAAEYEALFEQFTYLFIYLQTNSHSRQALFRGVGFFKVSIKYFTKNQQKKEAMN